MKRQIKSALRCTGRLQLAYNLLQMTFLLYMVNIISSVMGKVVSGSIKVAIEELIIFIVCCVGVGVLLIFLKGKLNAVRIKESFCAKEKVYQTILQASLDKVESGGKVLEYIQNDFQRISDYYGERLSNIIIAGLASVIWFIYAVNVCWQIAILMIIFAGIQIISPLLVKNAFEKQYLDCREIEGELTEVILDANAGIEEIKVYQGEPWVVEIMRKKQKRYKVVGMKSETAVTQEIMVSSFISQFITYGFYVIVGLFFSKDYISFAQMMLLVLISTDFYEKVLQLFKEIPEISQDRLAVDRLKQWENETYNEQMEINVYDEKILKKMYLYCRNICFSYGKNIILKNFSCKASLSQKTAIVGENGSGKTTLLKIIAGIEKPDKGGIFSDNDCFNSLLETKQVVYLPQDCPELQFTIFKHGIWKESTAFFERFF